jgi:hypothetical protein
MATDIATLGEKALRRLGVAIIPVADRPMLTVMVPPATIATAALVELGVIASDETPSSTDQALALQKVQAVQASLASQALVWWDDTGVPSALVEEYTKLAASLMASSFGKSGDPNLYAMLEGRVKRMALILSANDQATDAVQGVHNDLLARGIARWSSLDIPEQVGDAYVLLAANQLAPLFDKPFSPVFDQQANRALAQYVSLPSSGERVQMEAF